MCVCVVCVWRIMVVVCMVYIMEMEQTDREDMYIQCQVCCHEHTTPTPHIPQCIPNALRRKHTLGVFHLPLAPAMGSGMQVTQCRLGHRFQHSRGGMITSTPNVGQPIHHIAYILRAQLVGFCQDDMHEIVEDGRLLREHGSQVKLAKGPYDIGETLWLYRGKAKTGEGLEET